jgi:hypothetical protein
MKTVKPERPFSFVRAHDRSEALDQARRQAFCFIEISRPWQHAAGSGAAFGQ